MMKRQFAMFLVVSVVIAVWGLLYASQVVSDLTLLYPTTIDIPGTKIVLSPNNLDSATNTSCLEVQEAQRVVAQRLEQLNLQEDYGVAIQGNHLEVILSHNENIPYLIRVMTRRGQIEFIDGGHVSPPIGRVVKTGPESISNQNVYQTLFTGRQITTIIPPDTESGDIFYQIELQPAAVERLSNFTRTKTKAYTCLVIDKQVINCSKMYHLSGNTLDILPNLGAETGLTVTDLALFLKSGPLPMLLEVVTD